MARLLEAPLTSRLDVLGVLVFLGLVGAVGALVALPDPSLDAHHRPTLTWRVATGAPVELVVPAGSTRVKLVSIAEALPTPDRLHEPGYELRLAWIDDADAIVVERSVSLRSRPAELPDAEVGDAITLLAPRSTVVDVPEHTRPVVGLRVAVPDGAGAVRLRAFRDRPAALATPELDLMRVDERDAILLARQIGVPSWGDVTIDEALALVGLRWEPITPRRGTLPEGARTVTRVADPPMPAFAVRASGTTLIAGRALAFPLLAPFDVLLVGDGDLDRLALEAVVVDVGVVPVSIAPADAPPWRPGAKAVRVRAAGVGDATLHVRNDGFASVGTLLALLPRDAVDRVPVDGEAAPAASFADVGDDDALSVVPGWIALDREAARDRQAVRFPLPDVVGQAIVRLELRPVDAEGLVAVDVAIVAVDGTTRTLTTTIPSVTSPYELAAPHGAPLDPARRVGEPVERYLAIRPGDVRLEVTAPGGGTVLVSAALPGPDLGRREVWDATRRTWVHYARDVLTAWAALPPVSADPWRIAALRRRELLPPDEGGDPGFARTYRALQPASEREGVPGETWLFALDETEPRAGLVYCGLKPGQTTRFAFPDAAVEELGGLLSAVVWAPGVEDDPELGGSVALLIDDHAWTRGRLSTPVLRHVARHVPAARARLEGPAGTRAWLRTIDRDGVPCDDARQAKRTIAVDATHVGRWEVDKQRASQILVIGGVADQPVDLVVDLVGGPGPDDALLPDWTLRHRLLHLEPTELGAVALDTPWRTGAVLASAGMRLKADLTGTFEVHVRAVSPSSARLFAVIEDAPSLARALDTPRRTRR